MSMAVIYPKFITTMASSSSRDKPKDLKFDSLVLDVCFHPSKDVLATGDIDGDVEIHSYSLSEENHRLLTLSHHKKSCRCLGFSPDGATLLTASKDKSIAMIDLNTGSVVHKMKKAHESAIYSMLVLDETFLATGDDDGTLKVWDLRQQTAVMDMKENEEFISDMVIDKDRKILAVTSGDGTLTAFNVRRKRMELQSELFDSELLSIAKVKDGSKVVCGSGDGTLNIFNWGEWGNISDRFPGHSGSIDCMVTVTKDLLCTGSMDGVIRAVHIVPNRIVGVVGKHKEFPVESLAISRDKTLLASSSHDQTVKFWNIENLHKEKIDSSKKAKKRDGQKTLGAEAKNDFFSDLVEKDEQEKGNNDSDDDDSGDSDSIDMNAIREQSNEDSDESK